MNTTRKFPRTLQEAFGPYAELHTERDTMNTADKLVVVASVIGLVAFVAMALAGWLPGGAA